MDYPVFTIDQVIRYLESLQDPRVNKEAMTLEDVETLFHNARFGMHDSKDGIEAWWWENA